MLCPSGAANTPKPKANIAIIHANGAVNIIFEPHINSSIMKLSRKYCLSLISADSTELRKNPAQKNTIAKNSPDTNAASGELKYTGTVSGGVNLFKTLK